MGRLKNIFSNHEVEFVGKLKFNDIEDKKIFLDKLEFSLNNPKSFKIGGVDTLTLKLDDGVNSYPILHEKVKDPIEFHPEKVIELPLKNGRIIPLFQSQLDNEIIIYTKIDGFIDLKVSFFKTNENINFSYSVNLKKETNCEKIKLGLESFLLLINFIFGVEENKNNKTLQNTLTFLKDLYLYFSLLCEIEKKIGVNFKYSDTIDFKDYFNDVIELFVFLKDKAPIRDNSKIQVTLENHSLEPNNKDIEIGTKFCLSGKTQKQYNLYGEKINLYFYQILFNCVVENIETNGDSTTIVIGNDDNNPIYTAYCGFINDVDILELNNSDPNLIKEYQNAKPITYYHNSLLEEVEKSLFENFIYENELEEVAN